MLTNLGIVVYNYCLFHFLPLAHSLPFFFEASVLFLPWTPPRYSILNDLIIYPEYLRQCFTVVVIQKLQLIRKLFKFPYKFFAGAHAVKSRRAYNSLNRLKVNLYFLCVCYLSTLMSFPDVIVQYQTWWQTEWIYCFKGQSQYKYFGNESVNEVWAVTEKLWSLFFSSIFRFDHMFIELKCHLTLLV